MLGESLLITVLYLCISDGLRVLDVEVPRYIIVGQGATLKCHFSLGGEKLYSLNWWKDDRQFYQYIPRNEPKMVVFEVPGVYVNKMKSGLHTVDLIRTETWSDGVYHCEIVGEGPMFTTHIMGSNLTVIDPPDGPPVVRGQKTIYHPGEIISLNCTSYRSRPRTQLKWEILKYNNSKELKPSSIASPLAASSPQIFLLTGSQAPLSSPSMTPSSSALLFNENVSSVSNKKRKHHSLPTLWSFSPNQYRRKSQKKTSSRSHKRGNFKLLSRGRVARSITSAQYEASNYSLVEQKHLLRYPVQPSGEGDSIVFSVTLGIQYPTILKEAPKGELTFRCSASIHNYDWATEVSVAIAAVPVADPQQLPTLHGTGAPRSWSSNKAASNVISIIFVLMLIR